MPNSPEDREPHYLSYLLRLWSKTDNQGKQVWCASLETPGSHRTVRFGDLPTLFAFLRTQLGGARPGESASEIYQTNKGEEPMSPEQNKAVIRRFFEEAFNQGNLAVLAEIVAPNQVNGGPGALPGMPSGPEGTKVLVTTYRNAFPDLHFTIDEQIAEGNTVVTRWTAHGTHNGELAGIPATGKPATVVGLGVDRVENGKIVESWGIFDQFGMLQQLGVIPAPAQVG